MDWSIQHILREETDMRTIGIDPGMSGAIAVLDENSAYTIIDMPTFQVVMSRRRSRKTGQIKEKKRTEYNIPQILLFLTQAKASAPEGQVEACLEAVHSMPKQGVRAMFSMGEGFGILKCALTATAISWTLVAPQTWKKAMMKGMGKEKDSSVYRALQLYPQAELMGPKGGRKHGRADALLMARYVQLYSKAGGGNAQQLPPPPESTVSEVTTPPDQFAQTMLEL